MSSLGSSFWVAKHNLIELLKDRPALADVKINYQSPIDLSDVQTDFGEFEAIFFDDSGSGIGPVTGKSFTSNKVICGIPFKIEDQTTIPLAVQVLREGLDDPQEDADKRVDELLYEVWCTIAHQPDLGVLAQYPEFEHFIITHAIQMERRTGKLREGAGGHGSYARYYLLVESRIRCL